MDIQPLSNFVFVHAEKKDEKKGEVFVARATKEKSERGVVLAVGPGKLDKHGNHVVPRVKEGDTVYYHPFLPQEIEVEGESILVLREDDIFGCIQK